MRNITVKSSKIGEVSFDLRRINAFIGPYSFMITGILSQVLQSEQRYLWHNEEVDLSSSGFEVYYDSDYCNIEVTESGTKYTKMAKNIPHQMENVGYISVNRETESNSDRWGDEYMPAFPILSEVKAGCSHLIIDEPEQGLLPSTQRDLLKYLVSNLSVKNSLTITTVSPYIVYTLNNCMLAGTIENQDVTVGVNPSDVGIWLLKDGDIKSLQNTENGLLTVDIFNEEFQKIHSEMFQLLKQK